MSRENPSRFDYARDLQILGQGAYGEEREMFDTGIRLFLSDEPAPEERLRISAYLKRISMPHLAEKILTPMVDRPTQPRNPAREQLDRLRGAPRLVGFLLQDIGCWVVGSRADFRQPERISVASDWDILVPLALWPKVRGALPFERSTTSRRGGWRFPGEAGEASIDLIILDVDDWFSTQPYTAAAWHPRSGTMLERRIDGYAEVVHELQRVETGTTPQAIANDLRRVATKFDTSLQSFTELGKLLRNASSLIDGLLSKSEP